MGPIGLLLNEGVFICNETVYEAGELIKVLWSYLSVAEKKLLEKKITNLVTSKLVKEEFEFTVRRIRRLLSCIPSDELLLSESKDFMAEHDSVKNEPLIKLNIPDFNLIVRQMRKGLGIWE